MTEHLEMTAYTESSTTMTSFLTTEETVSLQAARRVIAAGEETALALGLPMHLAVLDASGDLVAYARMDGTWLPDVGTGAENRLFHLAIQLAAAALAENGGQLTRFVSINQRDSTRLSIVVAATPLRRGLRPVGAVGVSGLSGEHDTAVATAAAGAFR
jgi:uncharacterized protein GlcG (DUF336 family)